MSDARPAIRIVDQADPAGERQIRDALYSFNVAATGIDDGRDLVAELRDDGELRRLGFEQVGELADYPPGGSDLLLLRRLP